MDSGALSSQTSTFKTHVGPILNGELMAKREKEEELVLEGCVFIFTHGYRHRSISALENGEPDSCDTDKHSLALSQT